MGNLKKYTQVFKDTFSVSEDALEQGYEMEDNELWDSVGHITLIANLETAFGIEIDIADMAEVISYEKGKEVLARYGVAF